MLKYIKQNIIGELNEIGQSSPLRFKILIEKEDTLVEVSQWMKCTDYLNDVVVRTFLNKTFTVHGFDNQFSVVNGDLFLAIKDIRKKEFFSNLELVNKWLEKQGHTYSVVRVTGEVDNVPKDVDILQIPRYYITNTFYMSLVMLLIRCCTYKALDNENRVLEQEIKGKTLLAKNPHFLRVFKPENKKFLDDNVFIWKYTTWEYPHNKSEYIIYNKYKLPDPMHIHNTGCLTTLDSIISTPELLAQVQ